MLNFAEHLILDAQRLWLEGSLDQRQRLQRALFPKGMSYAPGTGFGTTENCLFFKWLLAVPREDLVQASPTGFPRHSASIFRSEERSRRREQPPDATCRIGGVP